MKNLTFEQIIEYLKNNHPKKATEISDCLELLNMSLEGSLESLNSDMQTFMKEKNYSKLRELTDVSEEISNIQNSLEIYAALFIDEIEELQEVNDEVADTYTEGQKIIPNYSEYTVDNHKPHSLYESFTHKKACAFSISGQRYEAKDWKDVLVQTCNFLASKNKEEFNKFLKDPTMKGRKNSYFGTLPIENKNVKLNNLDIYVWTNLSANFIRNLIRKLLKKFDIKISEYSVYLRADYTSLHMEENEKDVRTKDDNNEKIGKLVRLSMRELSLKQNLFSTAELVEMQSKQWSKDVLGINYSFIKAYIEGEDLSVQIREGRYLRYWKEIFEFSGAKFLITSQWYDWNKDNFENWLKSINERGQK